MRFGRRELPLQRPAGQVAWSGRGARQRLVDDVEGFARCDRRERLRLIESQGRGARTAAVANVGEVAHAIDVDNQDPGRKSAPFGDRSNVHVSLRPPLVADLARILIAHHRRAARVLRRSACPRGR